jgi:N-acetylglucosaminyldiphosphoundecaprenol N-acetyl-beta-D-mannosaminyltransferase
MSTKTFPTCEQVINFPVAADSFETQVELILNWAQQRLSRVICVANVHMLMEAHSNPGFAQVLYGADMLTPDGMPLVWTMNLLSKRRHDRVCGMDLLRATCKQAEVRKIKVFFLGTEASTLSKMRARLEKEFPNLAIAGMDPLPFRALTPEEDQQVIQKINDSGANLLFVALGCPKQEIWMQQHRGKINAAMLGLGGVFPIYAGLKKHAPRWVQRSGLEWLYRLLQEPGRLWKRYSSTIPPFIVLSLKQITICRVKGRLYRTFNEN